MTVWENIAFGLKMRKAGKEEIKARVAELEGQTRPTRRRAWKSVFRPSSPAASVNATIAVARALAPQPQVLLLDEQFGGLSDAKVRLELQSWITELHDKSHVTTLFVTHDQDEAMAIASDILVMNKGKIEQEGTPLEIFDHPRTDRFVWRSSLVKPTMSMPRWSSPNSAIWGPFKFSGERVPSE